MPLSDGNIDKVQITQESSSLETDSNKVRPLFLSHLGCPLFHCPCVKSHAILFLQITNENENYVKCMKMKMLSV